MPAINAKFATVAMFVTLPYRRYYGHNNPDTKYRSSMALVIVINEGGEK